jgi:type IV pilus assembly protein PilV
MLAPHSTGRHACASAPRHDQRGVFLIEALLAILIFSLGILTLVAIQTAAITAQNDAQYRVEGANFADQIVSQIWLNVTRDSGTVNAASLQAFQHQATGAAASCAFSGTKSANALVTDWVASIQHAGTGLPGATDAMQQVLVDTTAAGYNKVTVTVCWQSPLDAAPHRHTLVSFIN